MPACPSCAKTFTWKDGSAFWNPWKFPCPYCGTILEASRIQKLIAAAVIPGGVLLALTMLMLEKFDVWQGSGRIAFIVVAAIALGAGALVSWRHTRFTIKTGRH